MDPNTPKFYLGTEIDGPDLDAEQLFVGETDLNDLIGSVSFTEALFHILLGRLPDDEEKELFDIVLVAFHGGFGLLPPTTLVPRLVAGTGVSTPQALAAGYLASGPYHVGAVEEAMGLFQEIYENYQAEQSASEGTSGELEQYAYDTIAGMIERKEKIPGYGHPLLRRDPRPTHTRRILCERGIHSPYFDVFDGVVRCMVEQKNIPANVDGVTAAILLKLGFQTKHGTGLFLLARTAAMLAHILEEQTDMPYHTQKRFMFLPVMLPKLFNADFKKLSKLFNRMRDHSPFLKVFYALKHKRRKPFLEREAAGQEVLQKYREEQADQTLSENLTSPSGTPGKTESLEHESEEFAELTSEEILEGAVWLLEAGADQLKEEGISEENDARQKLQEALELLRQSEASLSQKSP